MNQSMIDYTPIFNEKNRHELFMLTIDPGKSAIGLSLIAYKNTPSADPRNPLDYKTYWFAGWDVTCKGTVKRLEDQTKVLQYLLKHTPIMVEIYNNPKVIVCIEHQEGAKNPKIFFQLMRVTHLSGQFVGYMSGTKHKIIYAAKQSKWGWTSFNSMARALHLPPSKASQYNGTHSFQKRSMIAKQRTARKRFVTRYVILLCIYQDNSPCIKTLAMKANIGYFNHVADCIAQGMHKILSTLCHSNTFTNKLHENVENLIQSRDFKKQMKNHQFNPFIRQWLINQ